MSKKNNKSTRRKQYAFDLKREKEEQERKAKKLQKTEAKLKVKAFRGVKVGKKKLRIGSKLSKSEKAAVASKAMEIDK